MSAIHWFRQDLRLTDNPALTHACQHGKVLCIYILDDDAADQCPLGEASQVWLHHSLQSLDQALKGNLLCFKGEPEKILHQLIKQHSITTITWNRCYEPWAIKKDRALKATFKNQGIEVKSFNASLLWEPHTVLKADQTPYKVFTPFYKKGCLLATHPRLSLPRCDIKAVKANDSEKHKVTSLKLLPKKSWHHSMMRHWQVGEHAAFKQASEFFEHGISHYKEGRNFPSIKAVSRLSPHLHWGEISPHQLWEVAHHLAQDANTEHFLSELAWREFSYHLLYHFPHLPKNNFQTKFDAFPWRANQSRLKKWQQGQTGYPIVDAGMRELWQTGYMHNRVRMIVASFLTKNLGIHWHDGAAWFWDCLVDADLANNSASWQWVAGCGADAAPYFRIFNPVTQAEKFDPEGKYIRQYIPELASLPNKYLSKPWEAPKEVLDQAGVILGEHYPNPIVDLSASRQAALLAYEKMKSSFQD